MLLRNGRPWIAHGSMGGEVQPQIFAQFVSAVVDGGVDVATAVSAPRWAAVMPGNLEAPTMTRLESRVSDTVVNELRSLGHQVEMTDAWTSMMGHGHAIELVGGSGSAEADRSFAAAADPRSEGSAAAY
jgi:gamma-glutamyltranspeptidase